MADLDNTTKRKLELIFDMSGGYVLDFSNPRFADFMKTARAWQEDSTGRLRFETYQLLDTMLSLATEDDVRRFDFALREMGETRRL